MGGVGRSIPRVILEGRTDSLQDMDLAVISHHDLWVGRITRAVVGRLSSDLQRVPCPCGAIVST